MGGVHFREADRTSYIQEATLYSTHGYQRVSILNVSVRIFGKGENHERCGRKGHEAIVATQLHSIVPWSVPRSPHNTNCFAGPWQHMLANRRSEKTLHIGPYPCKFRYVISFVEQVRETKMGKVRV